MATITLNIPNNAYGTKALDNFCTKYGYTGFLADKVTVQTKIDFVKASLIAFLVEAVASQEAGINAATATTTARADIITNLIIT